MISMLEVGLSVMGGILLGQFARAAASSVNRQMQNDVNDLLREHSVDTPPPARVIDLSELRPFSWLEQGRVRVEAACFDCCVMGMLAAALGAHLPFPQAVVLISVVVVLALLAMCDLRFRVLPDPFIYCLLWAGVMAAVFRLTPCDAHQAVVGVVISYMSLWSLQALIRVVLKRHAIGAGDMKLAAAIGAWVGVELGLMAVMVALACSLILGGLMMVTGKRQVSIPFGPMLIGSGFLAIMFAFLERL
ncbi:prepilin peptidase [Herbaspirillum seropedicae]|uniref:prepilin peptidase n=1 Tax=Herbaspirillum seropedicae TaxID=964 RepID=UPI0028571080|nr:A24 family peptidase [Herbaspirillum seropedicae]MDR6398019.1 Flp pilus assembly protein protease CpaA [Herbaspirillum seropedicae]